MVIEPCVCLLRFVSLFFFNFLVHLKKDEFLLLLCRKHLVQLKVSAAFIALRGSKSLTEPQAHSHESDGGCCCSIINKPR